jgi:arabinofuranan 3-O-arabinosyltransferase
MLLAKPGWVAADTKQYLYLDPGRMLAAASYMWNPSSNLGTVTHENIGYLLPMGPFFWITAHLGIATWVAQRLWVGTILFAAGAGVLFLCRTLALSGPGQVVSALAYMLSPYLLQYVGRMSVILLPWAGLPWLVALAARSLRQRSWRYPAIFALVVTLVSGVTATGMLYSGLAPLGWNI